ncbi:MAG: insulinase family protein [Sphingomicrobium sp.]
MIGQRLVTGTARLRRCTSGVAVALALSFAPGLALAADPPKMNGWGIPLTDVTPDPAIRYGTLANGMKYAILKNSTPKGTGSLRLHFAFGSLAENDREQGLAHFIEHMAFNGTTNVPEGDMIKILERQGLAFGPDTNAMTGFDSTTYMLDVPKADAEHLDTAMFLLREVASEVKFDPAAVDRERGVILGEKRARENFQLRQTIDILGFQLPDAPYSKRLPIGTEQVLKTAAAADIRDLYRRYYRPGNATLIFVGDADPADIEARIRKVFASWKNDGPTGVPLPRGAIDIKRPGAFDTFVDPAVATTLSYAVARPWIDPPDTVAERQRKLIEGIATGLINRRLQRLSNVPGSPILGAGMGMQDHKDAGRMTMIQATAKDGAWKDALNMAEREVRRALDHGFSAAELKTQLSNMEGAYRTAAEQANTRNSAALANVIVSVVGEDDFVTTPAYRYAQFKTVAQTVTPAQVNAVFRALWTGSAPLIHLSSKQEVPTAQIAAALSASRAIAVAAPAEVTARTFAYDRLGTPGTVAEDRRIADLDVRTIRFANNVRLNIKKTDFEAGRVRFVVRLGNGQLDLPLDQPGLGLMMASTSSLGALKKHSFEELKEITSGKIVTLGTSMDDDAFVAAGATTQADFGLQMKVSAAYLLDPGFRPEAATQWSNLVPVFDKQIDAQPQGVAQARLPILLANGDQRFGVPSGALLAQRSLSEARAALRPVIASAPIEVTIVGDIEEQAAIQAVAATFGALPKRRLTSTPNQSALKVTFRQNRSPIVLTHEGAADQALVAAIWPTTDDHDFRKEVGLDLLGNILRLKLTETVREQLGSSYGVAVGSQMSDTFTGFGYLSASAVVAPDKTDEVAKAFFDAAAQLRERPVDADLLARARAPEIEALDRSRRENGFWLGALAKAQSKPDRLDRIRQQKAVIQSIAPVELQALARTYLAPERLQQARIVSRKLAAAATAR